MNQFRIKIKQLYISAVLIIIILYCKESVSSGEISELIQQTLPVSRAIKICQLLSNGAKAYGVTHPNYCSRYIYCTILSEPDEHGNKIKAEEKICEKCDAHSDKISCPTGFKNWDEAKQSCVLPLTQDRCRQMELPRHNVWGDKSLDFVCENAPIGKIKQYQHPARCGAFVKCYKDPVFVGDLWVSVESCPTCDTDDPKCPDGLMHFPLGGGGTDVACILPGDMEQPCFDDNEFVPEIPAGKSDDQPIEVEQNLPAYAATYAAAQFCLRTDKVTKRYPIPGKCQQYYLCWANLFDKDGDMRRVSDVRHYEFTCPLCFERDSDPPKCPSVSSDDPSYLYFDPELLTCVIPIQKTCKKDGRLEETKQPPAEILVEAQGFCKNIEPETKRFANPKKCHSYFICWANLYDVNGERRPLDTVKHLQFKCHFAPDKKSYLRFDNEKSKCVPLPEGQVCRPDGTIGGSNDLMNVTKVIDWKEPMMQQVDVTTFCLGKNDSGFYPHPVDTSCSRFIDCWLEQSSYQERFCPACHESFINSKTLCPTGHLFFDTKTSVCTIGAGSSCTPEPWAPVKEFGPDPVKIYSTTPNPLEQTIEGDDEVPKHTELMKSRNCVPNSYVRRGYCKHYWSCNRKTRREKRRKCAGSLYWNPDVLKDHGGSCDYLKNIKNFTLLRYKSDSGCALHTTYFRHDQNECSRNYFYYHPTLTLGREVKLECPDDLLWSRAVRTCVRCEDAHKKDGVTPCCTGEDVDDDENDI